MLSLILIVACDGGLDSAGDSSTTSSEPTALLVVETGTARIAWHDESAALMGEQCLSELWPEDCVGNDCKLFGGILPGSESLITYTRKDADSGRTFGGVARFTAGRPPTLVETIEVPAMRMPHDVVAFEGGLAVADTGNSRVLFLDASGELVGTLDASVAGFDDCAWVNHLQLVDEGLLTTCKGVGTEGGSADEGFIALWDVSDLDDISRHWRWPESGFVASPHDGHVTGDLLLYAHSRGGGPLTGEPQLGSVGFARWSGTSPPTYLGDAKTDDLGFLRSVELTPDGTLWVNDNGCQIGGEHCEQYPAVIEAALPVLEETGLTGAWTEDHSQQLYLDLEVRDSDFIEDLHEAFEIRVWSTDDVPVSGVCPG